MEPQSVLVSQASGVKCRHDSPAITSHKTRLDRMQPWPVYYENTVRIFLSFLSVAVVTVSHELMCDPAAPFPCNHPPCHAMRA